MLCPAVSLSWSAPGAAAAQGSPQSPGLSSDPEKLLSTFGCVWGGGQMAFAGFGPLQEKFGCKNAECFIVRFCEGLED